MGDVLSYRLGSGRDCLLLVAAHRDDRGGVSPILRPLRWDGEAPPKARKLRALEAQPAVEPWDGHTIFLWLAQKDEDDHPTRGIETLGDSRTLLRRHGGPTDGFSETETTLRSDWATLDSKLDELFGLR